jgi:hypothetical protein
VASETVVRNVRMMISPVERLAAMMSLPRAPPCEAVHSDVRAVTASCR